jgi:hypothetical protein
MSMLESAIWIMTLSIMLTANLAAMIDEAARGQREGNFRVGMFLFNLFAAALVVLALFNQFNTVVRYQEAPKVYTTETPQVDTLQENGKTFYIYKFQDNHYPDFK